MQAFIHFTSRTLRIDGQYFLTGGFWLLVAQASTVLTSLLVAVLFTRTLPESTYGTYRYIIELGTLLGAFSLTGISQTVLQASASGHRAILSESTKTTLLYSLGTTLLATLGGIYYFIQGNYTLVWGCLLIALLQPTFQFFLNTLSFLYGRHQFQAGAVMQTIKSLLVSLCSLAVLFFTHNILWLLLAYFVSQAIAAVALYRFYSPPDKPPATPPAVLARAIAYARHTSLRNVIIGTANRLDSIIVFQVLGAAALALYTVISVIPEHVRGSLKNLQTLLIPKYSKHESLASIRRQIGKRSIQFFCLLCVPTIGFILVAPPIYLWLFPTYPQAVQYITVIALSFPASLFLLPLGALQVRQLEKPLYIFHITTSVGQILLLFFGTLSFGILGAVTARVLGQYLQTGIAYALLYTATDSPTVDASS